MADCRSCGAELRAGVSFCTRCGASATITPPKPIPAPSVQPQPPVQPPPQPPPVPPPLVTVRSTVLRRPRARQRGMVRLGGLAAVALAIILVLVWNDNDSTTDGHTETGAPNAGGTPAPTDPATAEQALRAQVAADRTTAEDYVDRWVPQLSSKRLGMVADGITYGYPEIYADFKFLNRLYPDALLVWSGDFSSFRAGDFWVTLVAIGFDTGAGANAWCDGEEIGPGGCYAKRLSHTGGYDENTLHRG